MQIIRARNEAGVRVMEENLLDDPDSMDKDLLVEELKKMIPDSEVCYVSQAWDGETLRAFLVAFAPPNRSHVFLLQAWADKEIPSLWKDRMFLRLCFWTEQIGRESIRAETLRNPKALLRTWGFEEHSTVLSFNVAEDLEEKLLKTKNHANLIKRLKDKPEVGLSEVIQPTPEKE